ncbi:hypothetical protein GCM10020221_03390 [Streptomyces thioluteus]|uniref:DUF4070 domain-containing protein n=1 Tax=Streptomyces thioluteus TaxID=66431 RepID=A0ABN3WCV7_STRTU
MPGTPLWRRLEKEGRILDDAGNRESNVVFRLPEDVVLDGWRRVIGHAYRPAHLYGRYLHQMTTTYPRRLPCPRSSRRYAPRTVLRSLPIIARVLWHCGVRADYRRDFWRMTADALRRRDIEGMMQAAVTGHHLIRFARDAIAGRAEKSFYAPPALARPAARDA